MSTAETKLHKNQAGLVSFLVVTIIMLLLTLIVLAFARLVRREQVQTLDRQLNTQAFYAAESGVNDALNALAADPSLANGTTDCDDFITNAGLNNDLGNGVSYSCLLVDASPPELNFSNISTDRSTVTPIKAQGGVPITSLQISWEDTAGGTNLSGCPAAGTFPTTWSNSCSVGVMRLELLPFSSPTNRSTFITSRGIAFVSPRSSGGASNATLDSMSGDNQGSTIAGDCDGGGPGPRLCNLVITGTNLSGYLRMRSIYRGSAVTIRVFSGSTQVDLEGSQAEIDATGRVSGVLKRIKVTAPILASTGEPLPDFALQTRKTQCKRFALNSLAVTPELPGGVTDPNDYCDPLSP